MNLQSPQSWHHRAGFNMSKAQHAQTAAVVQCYHSRKAQEQAVEGSLDMYHELTSTLEQKVHTSHGLVEALQWRTDSLQSSVQLARQSLGRVEAALAAKEGPMQLCCWHSEQRNARPKRELVRDVVEDTLEEERAAIAETQRRLADAARRTRAAIAELEAKLQELRRDIDHKTQAVSLDEMCLRTTASSHNTVLLRCERPRSASLGSSGARWRKPEEHEALRESRKRELIRERRAAYLDRMTEQQEEAARSLCEENDKLVEQCSKATEDAAARTERAMQLRIAEHQQMRKRLEDEVKETEGKIEHVMGTISDTRFQITALDEPMELTSACASWRSRRVDPENIADPVSTRIQDHQSVSLKARKELAQHQQAEKAKLQHLQEARERLVDDLRDKTAALRIDSQCLAHQAGRQRQPQAEAAAEEPPLFAQPLRSELCASPAGSVCSLPRGEPRAATPRDSTLSLPRSELHAPLTTAPLHLLAHGGASPPSLTQSELRTPTAVSPTAASPLRSPLHSPVHGGSTPLSVRSSWHSQAGSIRGSGAATPTYPLRTGRTLPALREGSVSGRSNGSAWPESAR